MNNNKWVQRWHHLKWFCFMSLLFTYSKKLSQFTSLMLFCLITILFVKQDLIIYFCFEAPSHFMFFFLCFCRRYRKMLLVILFLFRNTILYLSSAKKLNRSCKHTTGNTILYFYWVFRTVSIVYSFYSFFKSLLILTDEELVFFILKHFWIQINLISTFYSLIHF